MSPPWPYSAVVLSERRSHPLAVFQLIRATVTRYLNRHLGRDLGFPHELLNVLRQQFHQA